VKVFQEESFQMSLEPFLPPSALPPNFSDYSLALDRLQRRTALRRAVMGAGVDSFEMAGGEEQERRDREVLDVWERHNGPGWLGY
jgi:hypothetical protein